MRADRVEELGCRPVVLEILSANNECVTGSEGGILIMVIYATHGFYYKHGIVCLCGKCYWEILQNKIFGRLHHFDAGMHIRTLFDIIFTRTYTATPIMHIVLSFSAWGVM